jgi:branched-subunit amino acid aminotransferase/4-amino-4-deoxychorismate lyase
MRLFIRFNDKILPAGEALIPVLSSAFLYGRGVFTTLGIYRGKPFLWTEHWSRLQSHAVKIGLDTTVWNEESVKKALFELLSANQIIKGRARISLFERRSDSIWPNAEKPVFNTDLLINTGELREISPDGLKITISPFRINSASPLAGLKSVNYLEKLLSLEHAKKQGFDEAICLNERGEIVSAVMSNIFWITENKIFTPSLKTGALAGTMRQFVLQSAKKLNISVQQGEFSWSELEKADEIFLTSNGLGIINVQALDSTIYQSWGEAFLQLRTAFCQAVAE